MNNMILTEKPKIFPVGSKDPDLIISQKNGITEIESYAGSRQELLNQLTLPLLLSLSMLLFITIYNVEYIIYIEILFLGLILEIFVKTSTSSNQIIRLDSNEISIIKRAPIEFARNDKIIYEGSLDRIIQAKAEGGLNPPIVKIGRFSYEKKDKTFYVFLKKKAIDNKIFEHIRIESAELIADIINSAKRKSIENS